MRVYPHEKEIDKGIVHKVEGIGQAAQETAHGTQAGTADSNARTPHHEKRKEQERAEKVEDTIVEGMLITAYLLHAHYGYDEQGGHKEACSARDGSSAGG